MYDVTYYASITMMFADEDPVIIKFLFQNKGYEQTRMIDKQVLLVDEKNSQE